MAIKLDILEGRNQHVLLLDCITNSYKMKSSEGVEYDLFPYGFVFPNEIQLTNKNANCNYLHFTIIECNHLFKESIFEVKYRLDKMYKLPQSLNLNINIDSLGIIKICFEEKFHSIDKFSSIEEISDDSSEIIPILKSVI